MPNRIIRQGIIDSERVNQLDWPDEVFYRRLLNIVDDHGLYDARPARLRASLYPLKLDRVREADISRWIAACVKAGLIALYMSGGKEYLTVLNTRWQARSEPKFPLPDANGAQLRATDNSCALLSETLVGDEVGDDLKAALSSPSAGSAAAEKINPADVLIEWNACIGLRPAKSMTKERKAALNVRSKEQFFRDNWREAITKVAASDFCCGGGSQGWIADIDWLLKPGIVTKILEGKYDNNSHQNQPDLLKNLRDYAKGSEK